VVTGTETKAVNAISAELETQVLRTGHLATMLDAGSRGSLGE
jgi:hypothetical protein